MRGFIAAWPADRDVEAGSAHESFSKGSHAPSAWVVEEAATEMVAVQDVLNAGAGDVTVAGVADDLEPRLQIVAKRAHSAAQVGGHAAAGEAVESVAAIKLDQEVVMNAGGWLLPTGASADALDRLCCWL